MSSARRALFFQRVVWQLQIFIVVTESRGGSLQRAAGEAIAPIAGESIYGTLRANAVAVLHPQLLHAPTVTPLPPGPDSLLEALTLLVGPDLALDVPAARLMLADHAVASVAHPTCQTYALLSQALKSGAKPHALLRESAVREAPWVRDLGGPLSEDFEELARHVVEQVAAIATPGTQPPLAVLTLASSVASCCFKVLFLFRIFHKVVCRV
jgi:hypothetical protein